MSGLVRPFQNMDTKKTKQFGGKSCSLGEMLQTGIPVPNGFAISVDAQKAFEHNSFSDEFREELRENFEMLKLDRVAVRSSAIAEDSSDASWAGQLESYLNVGFEDLEDSIRKCWNSINAKHAVEYGKDKGLKKEDMLVGVAVQAMAPSDVSGVMFTVDPVTKDAGKMIIEGLYGLGELLVQGITTPDRYTIDTRNMVVTNFEIEIKNQMMVYQNSGNTIIDVPKNIEDRAVLREGQVIELAELGKKIEHHYGIPQDIEWSLVNGRFYIIQSRPITTL